MPGPRTRRREVPERTAWVTTPGRRCRVAASPHPMYSGDARAASRRWWDATTAQAGGCRSCTGSDAHGQTAQGRPREEDGPCRP
eukprot:7628245-Prorocentrum_lima.AAC.1